MKRRVTFSLQHKLLLVFLLFLFMPLLIMGFLVHNRYYNYFLEKEITLSSQKIDEATLKLEDYIEQIDRLTFDIVYNEDIQDLLMDFNPNRFIGTRVESKYFQDQFGVNRLDDNNIYYLKVSTLDGQIGISVGNTFPEDENFDNTFSDGTQKSLWNLPRTVSTFYNDQVSLISFYQKITTSYGQIPIGTLRIDIREQEFIDLMSEFNYLPNSMVLLLNRDGKIVSSSGKLQEEGVLTNIKAQCIDLESTEAKTFTLSSKSGDHYLIVGNPINNGWRLVHVIPASSIEEQALSIKQYTYIVAFGVILFSLILCILLSFFILRPLKRLMTATQDLQDGNLNTKADIRSRDEFGQLADSFNQMTDRIGFLIQKNAEIKRQETIAELLYMNSQINPHFLYNTLDSIRWNARRQGALEVSQQIEMLSDLFRYYLSKESKFVTFQEEIHHIENYLNIQKLRFKEKLSYTIDFDNQVKSLYTIRLILQPLVENSIVHGLENKIDDGHLSIIGKIDNEDVIITVKDDGIGINEELVMKQLLDNNPQKAFALKNIDDRLRLHFGKEYGITFHSIPGIGTNVTLRLPILIKPPSDDLPL
ncbi:sensor histidine kinase [Massiliimalia massiliensis]|uniref:sensor histidine kinase n=1 Tax=Massiliimalia massiliensis TaxID=1852384 RepID=UPI000985E6AA|nr:sensor histidine kinase [Massiliimalia massiliensis]